MSFEYYVRYDFKRLKKTPMYKVSFKIFDILPILALLKLTSSKIRPGALLILYIQTYKSHTQIHTGNWHAYVYTYIHA